LYESAFAHNTPGYAGEAGLNVLINNAGVLPRQQEFGVADRRIMAEAYDINTIAPIMCAQVFHPLLRTAAAVNADKPMGAARALIFNMSTGAASIEDNGSGSKLGGLAYRCSKVGATRVFHMIDFPQAALNMASKCMSIDMKADNIVTIAVLPGYVATDMTNNQGMQ
jgi:NAD(P)-dependent dehydrogenase (short-subunit alcohol dehydrogenase family)